jgi:hypothetical protein
MDARMRWPAPSSKAASPSTWPKAYDLPLRIIYGRSTHRADNAGKMRAGVEQIVGDFSNRLGQPDWQAGYVDLRGIRAP